MKRLSLLLALLGFAPMAWAQNYYTDCWWDNENKTIVQMPRAIPSDAVTVNSSTNSFNNGWYVVSGNVTINSNVRCSGHVKLILFDNAHLTITGGLTVMNWSESLATHSASTASPMVQRWASSPSPATTMVMPA